MLNHRGACWIPMPLCFSSFSFSAHRDMGRRGKRSPGWRWWLQEQPRCARGTPAQVSDLRPGHTTAASKLPYKPRSPQWTRDPWLHSALCFISGSAFLTTVLEWCQSLSELISLLAITRIINTSFKAENSSLNFSTLWLNLSLPAAQQLPEALTW